MAHYPVPGVTNTLTNTEALTLTLKNVLDLRTQAPNLSLRFLLLFATLAGDGSSDGGGEAEAVTGGNPEEEAKTGRVKLNVWISMI